MIAGSLVLAAGRSTRILPLAGDRPKPLLEVGGRSLLEWNLRWLAESGLDPIWINLHYRAAQVREAAASFAGATIRFSYEDPILGTAGAWRKLVETWEGTSLVVYGDNLMRFDLAGFLDTHAAGGAMATVALYDPAVHAHTGIAGGQVVVDRSGRITSFEERRGSAPSRKLVNAGAYLLEPALAERVGDGFRDFGRDVFPELVDSGVLFGHLIEEGAFCLGLDTPEHFEIGRRMVEGGDVALT